MKRTLAVYKSTKYDWMEIIRVVTDERENDPEFIRITGAVEVEFLELEIDYNAAQVKAVEAEIEKVREEALELIGKLENRKAELLALTHEVKS